MAAVRLGGNLFIWGSSGGNYTGTYNNGYQEYYTSSPVQVGSSSWSAIGSAGAYFYGIISGNLYGFTTSAASESGLQYTVSPTQIGSTTSWSSVSAGGDMTAAIRSDKTLWTWGNNFYGQLGNQNVYDVSSPVQIGTSSWNFVSNGGYNVSAIRSDGYLFQWGVYTLIQSYANFMINQVVSSPTLIGTTNWSTFSTNGVTSAGIKSDGTLWTWGQNSYGALGININNGYNINSAVINSPIQVGTSSWIAVSVGAENIVAIRTGGTLFAWGSNVIGQCCQPTTTGAYSSPVSIGSSTWSAVFAGSTGITNTAGHFFAIRSDGRLFAWGDNSYYQLGISNNTTTYFSSPVAVGSSSWTSISTGKNTPYILGIRTGGSL